MMIQNKSIFAMLGLFLLSGFSAPHAHADVIYYNFESGKTFALYASNGIIFKQECPAMNSLDNGRADCKGNPIQVMKLTDATAIVTKNLNHVATAGTALEPLSGDTMSLLFAGAPYSQPDLDAQKVSLTNEQAGYQKLLTKFGADATIQAKADANAAAMSDLNVKIKANTDYAVAVSDFTPLLTTYLDLIAKPDSKIELVASKVKGTVAGALSQIMLHYNPNYVAPTSIGMGVVVTVNQGEKCHKCSERKSKNYWGVSGPVTQTTNTDQGYFVQTMLSDSEGGWWHLEQVHVTAEDWSN